MEARTKTRSTFVAVIAVVALALAGVVALAGCSAAPAESEGTSMSDSSNAYAKITADEAKTMMDAGDVTIVDVRTAQEYADGHVPGAINIPLESIGSDKPAELTDTDADLIVYCRTGVRSKQASDKLVELGYQHVNDMGGIVDWKGETVTGDQPGSK
jgi:phage shock protein E